MTYKYNIYIYIYIYIVEERIRLKFLQNFRSLIYDVVSNRCEFSCQKIIEKANEILTRVENSGYRLGNHRFIWGSNKMAAEEGITLVYAYQISKDQRYQNAALEQLHFLLGRNPFNQTFVTGIGARPVRHVNHLFARAKGLLIPGLVVGGPNSDAQDNIAPKGLGILSYLDDEQSYATNEYAIDYNASLIGLIGLLISGNA